MEERCEHCGKQVYGKGCDNPDCYINTEVGGETMIDYGEFKGNKMIK